MRRTLRGRIDALATYSYIGWVGKGKQGRERGAGGGSLACRQCACSWHVPQSHTCRPGALDPHTCGAVRMHARLTNKPANTTNLSNKPELLMSLSHMLLLHWLLVLGST